MNTQEWRDSLNAAINCEASPELLEIMRKQSGVHSACAVGAQFDNDIRKCYFFIVPADENDDSNEYAVNEARALEKASFEFWELVKTHNYISALTLMDEIEMLANTYKKKTQKVSRAGTKLR